MAPPRLGSARVEKTPTLDGVGDDKIWKAVVNKLDFLWPMPGPGMVYASPIWSELPANEGLLRGPRLRHPASPVWR